MPRAIDYIYFLHFIDVEKSTLNISSENWELISWRFSYINPSYSLASSELNEFLNDIGNRLFWFRHFRDSESENALLPICAPKKFQMDEYCRTHRLRSQVKLCLDTIREKYPIIQGLFEQVKRVVYHNFYIQKFSLPK